MNLVLNRFKNFFSGRSSLQHQVLNFWFNDWQKKLHTYQDLESELKKILKIYG